MPTLDEIRKGMLVRSLPKTETEPRPEPVTRTSGPRDERPNREIHDCAECRGEGGRFGGGAVEDCVNCKGCGAFATCRDCRGTGTYKPKKDGVGEWTCYTCNGRGLVTFQREHECGYCGGRGGGHSGSDGYVCDYCNGKGRIASTVGPFSDGLTLKTHKCDNCGGSGHMPCRCDYPVCMCDTTCRPCDGKGSLASS